jgi:glycogen(starch) synthase
MKNINPTLIIESAWEVCNQVGGIYTVIRSKVPSMMDKFGSKYIAVGPYKRKSASGEFEHKDLPDSPVGKAIKDMWDAGLDVHYGSWLISGRPSTILFNIESVSNNLYGIKNEIARKFNLDLSNVEELFDEVMLFGAMYDIFLNNLAKYVDSKNSNILLHFHEWMSVSHISNIKERNLPYKTIFTTHATILGRYLAMNDPGFYSNLPHYDWYKESSYFNILPQVTFERVAASSCDTLTTVSNITANECKYLLGREVDGILPNGLNIDRFVATHKIEALHTDI